MSNLTKVSYCGIYCGTCKNFKQNADCQGCRSEEELLSDCPSRKCTIARGLTHCGECKEFPCDMMKEFYNDGVPMHEQAQKNTLRLNKVGIDKYVKEMEK